MITRIGIIRGFVAKTIFFDTLKLTYRFLVFFLFLLLFLAVFGLYTVVASGF
jgi:hypothetical protein